MYVKTNMNDYSLYNCDNYLCDQYALICVTLVGHVFHILCIITVFPACLNCVAGYCVWYGK